MDKKISAAISNGLLKLIIAPICLLWVARHFTTVEYSWSNWFAVVVAVDIFQSLVLVSSKHGQDSP